MSAVGAPRRRIRYGRWATLASLIVLLGVVGGVLLIYAIHGFRVAPPAEGPLDVGAAEAHARRVTVLMMLVLASGLLLVLFIVGAYFLLRAGRGLRDADPHGPTLYVDAWGRYRLTDEQIRAATDHESGDSPPQTPPS